MPTILSSKKEKEIISIIKKLKLIPITISFFLVVFTLFFVRDLARRSVYGINNQSLPYPGMLPNSPLYPVKELRDSVLVISTRDPINKAGLYFHLSAKMMSAARMAANCSVAVLAANRAVYYLDESKSALIYGKGMGLEPDVQLIESYYMSEKKYKSIFRHLAKKCSDKKYHNQIINVRKEHSKFMSWFYSQYSDQ